MKKIFKNIKPSILFLAIIIILLVLLLYEWLFMLIPSNQVKALIKSEAYLEDKYNKEFVFKNIFVSMEPLCYYVYFSDPQNSGLTCHVTSTYKFDDFWDNYKSRFIEYENEIVINNMLKKYDLSQASVSLHVTPSDVNDNIGFIDAIEYLQNHGFDYTISVKFPYKYVNTEKSKAMQKLWDTIIVLKQLGYEPKILSLYYNNAEFMLYDPNSLTDHKQMEDKIEMYDPTTFKKIE